MSERIVECDYCGQTAIFSPGSDAFSRATGEQA